MTDREAAALRDYIQKGGFVIVDDFKPRRRGRFGGGRFGDDLDAGYGSGWGVFEAAMKRVMPQGQFIDLQASQPIFHAFFEIDRLDIIPQAYIQDSRSSAGFRGERSHEAPADDCELQH